jgi:RNA polymerase sigma-70 factor, ECF subfamily
MRNMIYPAGAPACRPDLPVRFARTYREEHDFVVSLVRRLGVPAGDVEDAVQDVFVVLHRRLHELEAGVALRYWLRSVTFRVCSNHRRKLSVHWPRSRGEPIDPDSLHDVLHRLPDEARALSEARQALARALSRLDGEKLEVFVLTELEERTASEIAELTQTSPNTVASRLRAARKRIAHVIRAGPCSAPRS